MVDNNKKNNIKTGSNSPKVEKYVTNIKELPTFSTDASAGKQEKKIEYKTHVVEDKKEAPAPKPMTEPMGTTKPPSVDKVEQPNDNRDLKGTKSNVDRKPYSIKDIILGVINLIALVLLFIFLSKLSSQAEFLKELKTENTISQTPLELEFDDIQKAEVKTNEMNMLFIDEPGVVEFVNDVEKLRNEGSSQIQVSFASQTAVKDKTDNFGIPVVISLRGSWEQIGSDLTRIQTLPYLFRSVKVTSKNTEEDPNVIEFKYGIFLYVKDELGKT